MSYYSNPTANAAMGAVDKEIRAKQKLAKRLKALRKQGIMSAEQLATYQREFRGIHRRFYLEIFKNWIENLRQEFPAGGAFYPK